MPGMLKKVFVGQSCYMWLWHGLVFKGLFRVIKSSKDPESLCFVSQRTTRSRSSTLFACNIMCGFGSFVIAYYLLPLAKKTIKSRALW